MHVHLLGTAGYHPSDDRATNCVFLRGAGIALDAGTGFFRIGQIIQVPHLDILLSHAHLDHVVGIVYLKSVLRTAAAHNINVERVTIHCPPGVREAIERLFDEPYFSGSIESLPAEVTFSEVTEGEFEVEGGSKVIAKKLKHGENGSWAYRITRNFITVAYVTDTLMTDDAIDILKDAHLAICECYFQNKQREQAVAADHSYPLVVGQVAKKAGVKRLVLTHINPDLPDPRNLLDESSLFFPGAQLGADYRDIEI